MSESKRGVAMILQAGDPEISGAIAEGIMTARGAGAGDLIRPAARATFPNGGRLTVEQIETVEAEIDRQAIRRDMQSDAVQRALLRVAVNNTKTAEDYAAMTSRAEIEWGEPVDYPTPLERFADAALALYAMVICGLSAAYHAQDKVLGGSTWPEN